MRRVGGVSVASASSHIFHRQNVKPESRAEVGGQKAGEGGTEPLIPSDTVNHAE